MNSSGKSDRLAELQKCFDTMSDRIVDLQRPCEKLKLENDRLKEDYQALLESERLLEVDNEIMTMENNRLQNENNRLQLEVDPMQSSLQPKVDRLQESLDQLQIEYDCMVAANKRLRHGIVKHAEQASQMEDSLNELAYPFATYM
jgi:chromosome segregation ATPase